jgi:hypothetical protein
MSIYNIVNIPTYEEKFTRMSDSADICFMLKGTRYRSRIRFVKKLPISRTEDTRITAIGSKKQACSNFLNRIILFSEDTTENLIKNFI